MSAPRRPSRDCRISINGGRRILHAAPGSSLLAALAQHRIFLPGACGGRGICGFCKINLPEAPAPTPAERRLLDTAAIAAGVRLACQIRLTGHLAVKFA